MRTKTDWIVIHCAATKPGMDIGVDEIREWHQARGFRDVGYHFVIRRDGTLEKGRGLYEVGAHEPKVNRSSVAVCLVGGVDDNMQPEDNFTEAQDVALLDLLEELCSIFPQARIAGHRDFANKACPSFDVQSWLGPMGFPV